MPDPKKKPIVINSKNDPRYRAYQDSLFMYNKSNLEKFKDNSSVHKNTILNSTTKRQGDIKIKNIPFSLLSKNKINKDDYDNTKVSGKLFQDNIYGTPILPYKVAIRDEEFKRNSIRGTNVQFNLPFQKNTIDRQLIGLYKKPTQPVEVQQKNNPQKVFTRPTKDLVNKQTKDFQSVVMRKPIDTPQVTSLQQIQTKGLIESNQQINTPLATVRPQAQIPKSWNIDYSAQRMNNSKGYYNQNNVQGVDIETALRAQKQADRVNAEYEKKYGNSTNPKAIERLNTLKDTVTITPQYAYGGQLNNNMQNNNLTRFDEGGSHESSPLGGIPIGGNNRVEQGETKNKNFIYSDRLYANEDLAKQFNLPGYIKGKTFANASKAIDQKFNGRSDIHSNATKKELLDRLSGAQEHLKQQEEQVNQSLLANSQQIPDMMNGQIPEGMEEYVNQEPQQEQQFAFGGDMFGEIYGDPIIDPTKPIVPPKKINRNDLSSLTINNSETSNLNSTVKPIVKIQPGVRNDKMGPGYYVYSRYPVQNIESDREFISNSGYGALKGTRPYQEYMKSYNPSTMSYGVNKFDGGGYLGDNPYILGKGQSKPLTQVVTNDAQVEKGSSSNSGTYMAAAGQALGSMGSGLSANKKPMFSTEQDDKNAQLEDSVGKTKDGVAAAIGPWGTLFRGIEKLGQGVGDSVGGQTGDGIKTFFSPDETVMKMNSDSSISTGDKILGSLFTPYANLVTNRRKEQRQAEASRLYSKSFNDQYGDTYNNAYGGELKQYGNGGEYSVSGKKPLIIPTQGQSIIEERDLDLPITGNRWDKPERSISEIDREIIDDQQSVTSPLDFSKINKTDDSESMYSKASSYLDRNGGKFLKYAPVAMNAYQLSQLKKPENKMLQRLGNKYNPQYVDEAQLQNIVRQEGNNQSAAIQQMGGSEGALRNALLASGLNKTKALSDAYMKANAENRLINDTAQQFNLGVNQFNTQTQHKESENWERNAANYETQKSKLLSSIGTDLGSIGKEEVNKNQIAEALGYSWDGKHMTNKKTGKKITLEQLSALLQTQDTETKAYGGYLNMKKIGRG